MGNNLSVGISADVTDLQVKSAVAKAELRALTSEMNNLARAAAAGMGPEVGPALQAVAGDLVKAKSEATALSAEMKEMQGAAQGVGATVEEIGGKLTSAFQFTGIAVAVEGVHMLGEAIEELGARSAEILTSSDVLGVTVGQFQAMQVAAEESGLEVGTLTKAAEKLNVTLVEARQGSSSAEEKLLALGISAQQAQDPTFKISDLLESLHDRLVNTATSQETMNQLMVVLGSRAALAAEAIKKYDGSQEEVARIMQEINGLTEGNAKAAAEAKAQWDVFGTATKNSLTQFLFGTHAADGGVKDLIHSMGDLASKSQVPSGIASPASQQSAQAQQQAQQAAQAQMRAAQTAAAEEQRINKEILQQGMENIKTGVEAFKQGTQQRLDQLKLYAAAAAKYYGSDTVDVVVKANQEIIAEQRAVTERQVTELQKQRGGIQDLESFVRESYDAIMIDRQQNDLALVKADAEYVKESKAQAKELYEGWEQVYTEINTKHAALLKQESADTSKAAKDDATAWKSVVGEIESAESSMVSDILTKRKNLSQSIVALGAQLVTSEITNDIRAVTTRMLLQNTAATQQRALEQGGVLYHMAANAQQTASTAQSQSAQTSAIVAGNSARVSATISADSAAHAASAATGGATVMADAAKAFSGTYASVAQIPYVGWILAPIAASAAYAGVAAYEGLASLDTGTNYVPRDMLANIHEGEAVVPRAYNPAANPSMAMAGGYSEEHHNYNGDVHISHADLGKMIGGRSAQRQLITAIAAGYRRGARP